MNKSQNSLIVWLLLDLRYRWEDRERFTQRENDMTGSDLPTAKSSRSAHRSKHNEKTVIFPLFRDNSQTPSAFTCSLGFGCVIPTIPEVYDWKEPPNYSWCSSSLKWRNRRSWQWMQHSEQLKSDLKNDSLRYAYRTSRVILSFSSRSLNNSEQHRAAKRQALGKTERFGWKRVSLSLSSLSPPALQTGAQSFLITRSFISHNFS